MPLSQSREQAPLERVGVVVALAFEARALAPALSVTVTGMGPERAARGAAKMADAGATLLVSFGTAGALAAGCPPGSVLVPDEIVTSEGTRFPTDARRVSDVWPQSQAVRREPLCAIDGIVTGAQEKRELAARTGALAVDMESAAVAAVARDRGLEFVAVRVVIDGVDDVVPDFVPDVIDEFGRPRWRAMAGALLRHPGGVAALLRLARRRRAARRGLVAAARMLGRLRKPEAA